MRSAFEELTTDKAAPAEITDEAEVVDEDTGSRGGSRWKGGRAFEFFIIS